MFAVLPVSVQNQAREAYRLFRQNPAHPGLHFLCSSNHSISVSLKSGSRRWSDWVSAIDQQELRLEGVTFRDSNEHLLCAA